MSEFLANTVNIKEDVEFSGDVSFKELALIEPLKTKTVNGHSAETLIDWSKEVNLDHKLKVCIYDKLGMVILCEWNKNKIKLLSIGLVEFVNVIIHFIRYGCCLGVTAWQRMWVIFAQVL